MSGKLTPKQKREWDDWQLTCKRIKDTTRFDVKESKSDKDKRIKRLLKPEHFNDFINYYFKTEDFNPAPLAWFHKKAVDNLLNLKLRKHIWEWHRESAKSVFADIFIPIHMLISGELTGVVLASENGDKANNLIKDVEAQLRSNQRLISDFGSFGITGSWLQGFFQTKNSIGFWAFGLGQNPAGVRNGFNRPNLGIVDDADNKDKAKNQKLTQSRVDWIKGEFMGCLSKDNRYFIYLNNRVHREGITARLVGDIEDNDPKDTSYAHVKAYLTEHPITHEPIFPDGVTEEEILKDLTDKGAVPAWKEYYSLYDCVAKIVDYGMRNALRQMYHHHTEEGNIFNDDNMPWADPFLLSSYDALVTYCDPAFGESGKGCFKCIVLMGKKGHLYDVLHVWLKQKGNWINAHRYIAENLERLNDIPSAHQEGAKVKGSVKHWVEANSLQKTELRKSYQLENLDFEVPWYPRYDDDKKAEKFGRIENLEPIANHKHLRFNVNLKANKDMVKLREQFKGFPSGFIDGPDTVQGAIDKLDKMARKSTFKTRVGNYIKNSRW